MTPKRALQALAAAVLVGLVALLAVSVRDALDKTAFADSVDRGRRPAAPAFTLPALDGAGTVSLASLRGRVVVVNFWASWCDTCKDEAPLFERFASQFRGRVAFVGIDSQDTLGDARAFARDYGMTYTLARDHGNEIARRYSVQAWPETYVIDRDGRAVGHVGGEITDASLRAALAKAGVS